MTTLSNRALTATGDVGASMALATHETLADTLHDVKARLHRIHKWAKRHPNSKSFQHLQADIEKIHSHQMTLTQYVQHSDAGIDAVKKINAEVTDELEKVSAELDATLEAMLMMDDSHPQIALLIDRIEMVARTTEKNITRINLEAEIECGIRERLYEAGVDDVTDELIATVRYVVTGDIPGDLSDVEADALRGFAAILAKDF